MARTVSIVGMGPGNTALMTRGAQEALEQADLVVGARRLLESLPTGNARMVTAVTSTDVLAALDDASWGRAVIAMSGDVGMFSGARGLATKIREALGEVQVVTLPGISSMQCLAAALERPWQDWRFVSAHGVACDLVCLARTNPELFLVTGGENTVGALCERLARAGLGAARVSVGERLGYLEQRVVVSSAAELAGADFDQLSVMLVEAAECGEKPEVVWPWATPGIPDDQFERGRVPMTKQEIRAVALSKLGVAATDTIWDVGAGTGSVSVECALLARAGQVFAVERKPEAVELARRNARRFGLNNLQVIEGKAPDALLDLPAPQAVFVGGSAGTLAQVLDLALEKNPQVRVCVSAVTLETLAAATSLLASDAWEGFEAVQVQATRAESVAGYNMMRAQNPVFIVSARGRG